MRAKGRLATTFVLVGSAAILTGCAGRFAGGGSVVGASGDGRATFGFNYQCTETKSKGQLQYVDHSPGPGNPKQVRFHGRFDINSEDCIEVGEPQPPVLLAVGTYEPQPSKLGEGGLLLLFVIDGGEPGTNDDEFEIALEGGVYDGYSNGGPLIGGNIQQLP